MAPIEVVGTAEDESSALSWLARRAEPLRSGGGRHLPEERLRARRAEGGVARRDRPTKLVVLSNYATPDMRRKCLELGADRVFDKSNEIDALILYCCRLADGCTGHSSEYSPLS